MEESVRNGWIDGEHEQDGREERDGWNKEEVGDGGEGEEIGELSV